MPRTVNRAELLSGSMKLLTELLSLSEDWGSSDWKPVMDSMDRLIDDHFEGKRSRHNVELVAAEVADRWYELMGYDYAEDAVPSIVRVYMLRRKDTIVEAARELWPVHSRDGTVKKFAKIDGDWENPAQVKSWLKTTASIDGKMVWNGRDWELDPKVTDRAIRKQDREWKKEDREEARASKIDLQAVYNKVMQVVGDVFPDGEPMDRLVPALKKMGVPEFQIGDVVDKAMKKHGGRSEKKGLTSYLADMWDSMADDAMHDAQLDGPFVRNVGNKPVKQPNPWK